MVPEACLAAAAFIIGSMPVLAAPLERLAAIPALRIRRDVALSGYTRFGIGGPAAVLVETSDSASLQAAWSQAADLQLPRLMLGGGTNLIVSDAGFHGIALRYT